MGTNAGPQIANTYLHVYEYEYIKKLIENGDEVALSPRRIEMYEIIYERSPLFSSSDRDRGVG